MSAVLSRVGFAGVGALGAWTVAQGKALSELPRELWGELLGLLKRNPISPVPTTGVSAAGAGPTTIVVHSAGSSVSSRVLFIATPTAIFYAYIKYMGYSLADVQWVSASRFNNAVDQLGKAQQVLDTKLVAFRSSAEQALSAFRSVVERQFREQQQQIQDVDARLERMEGKIDDSSAESRAQILGLEGKMDEAGARLDSMQNSLEYSSQGINLLCNVVAEGFAGNDSNSVKRLQAFASTAPACLEASRPIGALDAPAVLIDNDVEVMKTSPTNFSGVVPNQIVPGLLGGVLAAGTAGTRGSVNLSHTAPGALGARTGSAEQADNPPEPSA